MFVNKDKLYKVGVILDKVNELMLARPKLFPELVKDTFAAMLSVVVS